MRSSLARPSASLAPLWLVAIALVFSACTGGGADKRTELVVYAASSLSEAFPQIAAAFGIQHPDIAIVFNFAGSATLRAQIESGAPADVYAAANLAQMDLAMESGVVGGPTIAFASNKVAVAVPADKPIVRDLRDLAKLGVKIIVASPHVPAGAYTREVLENLDVAFSNDGVPDFQRRALANVVSEETNVRGVLTKVVLAEADAGFVYVTDVTGSPNAERVVMIPIPDGYNVAATYVIGQIVDSRRAEAATAFIDFITSAEGATIMDRAGFGRVEPHDGPTI
jgi:molybdate transport system substrate-binding protein